MSRKHLANTWTAYEPMDESTTASQYISSTTNWKLRKSHPQDNVPAAAAAEEENGQRLDYSRNIMPSRIAFGSCNDQDKQNNLWQIIEARNPAAFIWGGDAIYAGK